MSAFDAAWVTLASQSKCDELGGVEWERVKALWQHSGHAEALEDFIREHANEIVSPTDDDDDGEGGAP